MKFGRLFDALHPRDLGQHGREQAGGVEQFEAAARRAFREQAGEFVANALGGNLVDFRRQAANGGEGGELNGEAESCRETDGAKHAEFVFLEAEFRVADGADEARIEIGAAADQIDHLAGARIHQQSVDREIAAANVVGRRMRIDHAIGMAAVGVADIGAERGDFDLNALLDHDHDAEFCADGQAAGEKRFDALGRGIGRDVVVGGFAAENQIAHAAADKIGLVAGLGEHAADFLGEFARSHAVIMDAGRAPKLVANEPDSDIGVAGCGNLLASRERVRRTAAGDAALVPTRLPTVNSPLVAQPLLAARLYQNRRMTPHWISRRRNED